MDSEAGSTYDKVVKILLAKGADMAANDTDGLTALDITKKCRKDNISIATGTATAVESVPA